MVWQWRGSLASSFLSVFLSWSTNTTSVAGKVHQHPFYLRKLNKSNLTQKLLVNFYHGTIGSMLIYCLSVWFASCMKAGKWIRGKSREYHRAQVARHHYCLHFPLHMPIQPHHQRPITSNPTLPPPIFYSQAVRHLNQTTPLRYHLVLIPQNPRQDLSEL